MLTLRIVLAAALVLAVAGHRGRWRRFQCETTPVVSGLNATALEGIWKLARGHKKLCGWNANVTVGADNSGTRDIGVILQRCVEWKLASFTHKLTGSVIKGTHSNYLNVESTIAHVGVNSTDNSYTHVLVSSCVSVTRWGRRKDLYQLPFLYSRTGADPNESAANDIINNVLENNRARYYVKAC